MGRNFIGVPSSKLYIQELPLYSLSGSSLSAVTAVYAKTVHYTLLITTYIRHRSCLYAISISGPRNFTACFPYQSINVNVKDLLMCKQLARSVLRMDRSPVASETRCPSVPNPTSKPFRQCDINNVDATCTNSVSE